MVQCKRLPDIPCTTLGLYPEGERLRTSERKVSLLEGQSKTSLALCTNHRHLLNLLSIHLEWNIIFPREHPES